MKYRKLGASDLQISEIGFGSWLTFTDPQRKQLRSTPQLPPWALSSRKPAPPRPEKTAPAVEKVRGPADPPSDGIELEQRLTVWDDRAVKGGFCKPGELFKYIAAFGMADCQMGQTPMADWPAEVVRAAWAELQCHAQDLKKRKVVDSLKDISEQWRRAQEKGDGV